MHNQVTNSNFITHNGIIISKKLVMAVSILDDRIVDQPLAVLQTPAF